MTKSFTIILVAALLILSFSYVHAQDNNAVVAALTQKVLPDNPQLLYGGRWETSSKDTYKCNWSGCAVTIKFTGSAIAADLGMGKNTRWQVEIDGKETSVIKPVDGQNIYELANGLSEGEHTCTLIKRTEALFGVASFKGFLLAPQDKVLAKKDYPYSLHVIGDSISCGYGNEASDQKQPFSPDTENGWAAYGALAAQNFGAEYVCTAWSGYKMWPDKLLPEIYLLTMPSDKKKEEWSFARPADAVIINLGTNDFSAANPDEEPWVKAYLDFLKVVRTKNPQAMIYCAIGPMLSDKWSKSKSALSTCRAYLQRIIKEANDSGDTKVKLLEFPMQDGKLGFGANWHPSLKTHALMADILSKSLEADLGWKKINDK